ncbi:MAG: phosphonate ABC transporter, permease protein PhnE, partial [Synechococcaceae cyanobacterium SM2_3_60]|nr:phosphonate ABC transporter, permease protein PhnE [Synechococcaceae cyanobacterium SM2_3_60]
MLSHRQAGSRHWSPPPLIRNPWLRWGLLLVAAVYLYFAISSLTIDPARIVRGISRSSRLFAGFLAPDFVTRWRQIERGIIESLVMTVVSSAAGVMLALPVGIGAARNVSVLPVYLVCRAFIAVSRTFQEVMIAILFVVMIGFGPLAGMLTLTFSSVGFLAKLLAEKIEEIDPAP